VKKALYLSNTLICRLLDQQAQEVSLAFVNRKPTTEQVEDLYEICRAFLADTPDTYQQKFDSGFSVGFDMAKAFTELEDRSAAAEPEEDDGDEAIEEFLSRLPAEAIQLPDAPAVPEPIQIFPPKVEDLAEEEVNSSSRITTTEPEAPMPRAKVEEPEKPAKTKQAADWPPKVIAKPEEEDKAPEPPRSIRIKADKALKACGYLSNGFKIAAERSELHPSDIKNLAEWLGRCFSVSSTVAVRYPLAQKQGCVRQASENGWLEIPVGGAA
jgi:hypothetical protein